jgi:hypothetical protein
MMAVLDLIDDGGELAAVPAVQAGAEYCGNLVGGEPPQAEFTTSADAEGRPCSMLLKMKAP